MKHKKDNHKEVVTFCWKFEAGNCLFGNQKCWFIHNEVKESTDYTCKLCDNTFPNLPELMKHKKSIIYKQSEFVKIEFVYTEDKNVGTSIKNQKQKLLNLLKKSLKIIKMKKQHKGYLK